LLPVRPDILDEAPYSTDPHYQVFKQALQYGRPVPAIPFWGPLEDGLRKGFGAIWKDIKASGDCSAVNDIVLHHLTPIAKRFDRLLKLVASEPAKMF
jgi:hypothetical protein